MTLLDLIDSLRETAVEEASGDATAHTRLLQHLHVLIHVAESPAEKTMRMRFQARKVNLALWSDTNTILDASEPLHQDGSRVWRPPSNRCKARRTCKCSIALETDWRRGALHQ